MLRLLSYHPEISKPESPDPPQGEGVVTKKVKQKPRFIHPARGIRGGLTIIKQYHHYGKSY